MKQELFWKVKSVVPTDDYLLQLTFADGKNGIFDMKPYLDKGIFQKLKDPELFSTVRVCASSIAWNNDIDIAPETLYYDSENV